MAIRKHRKTIDDVSRTTSWNVALSGAAAKIGSAIRKHALDVGLALAWMTLWAAIVNAQYARGFSMEFYFSVGMLLLPVVALLWHWRDRFGDINAVAAQYGLSMRRPRRSLPRR